MLPERLKGEEPLEENERRDEHQLLAVIRAAQKVQPLCANTTPLNDTPPVYHCKRLAQSSMNTVVFLR